MESKTHRPERRGRFLTQDPVKQVTQWLMRAALLFWDGLLLYMILEGRIDPVYGAAFVAVVSCYLGYQF